MTFKLKKLSKRKIYEVVRGCTPYRLPACKDCSFLPFNSYSGWLKTEDFVFYMGVCGGSCILRTQSTACNEEEVDEVLTIPFEWLFDRGYFAIKK